MNQPIDEKPVADEVALSRRLQALMRVSAEVVWWTNAVGEVTERVPDWESFTGQSFAEYRGRGWLDAVHAEDREFTQAAWQHAVEHQSGYYVEFRLRRADGAMRYMRTSGVPQRDAEGTIVEWAGICTDITEQKGASLAAGEEQFRMLAESIPQLAWIARADGHIFWYNQRWYEYTGTTPEDMEGWGWQRVHDPAVLPEVLARWQASIGTGEPFDMEFPLRGADGTFRWFLTRVQPMRDETGRVRRWFGTNTDVDERRRTIEFLEDARREADAANRAKSAFLAHMSHELRTPINAIMGYAQLLEMNVHGELNEKQLDHVRRVMGSSHHLLALVNDILDLTRIEAGAIVVRERPVPVRDALAQAIELVEPAAARRGVRLAGLDAVPADLRAACDADRLRQVVANLLMNAVKFSGADSVVHLHARAADGDGPEALDGAEAIRIDISDQGIGIDDALHDRIFEPFFQVDSGTTRSGGGSGLGLTISRRLARAMGGEVTVASRPGAGSTFSIWLQRASGE